MPLLLHREVAVCTAHKLVCAARIPQIEAFQAVKLASLPYRFKSGGESSKMPGPVATGHSHRPTTKVSHKAFKSKHATKSALRDAAKGKSHRENRDPGTWEQAIGLLHRSHRPQLMHLFLQGKSSAVCERRPTNKSCPSSTAETRTSSAKSKSTRST